MMDQCNVWFDFWHLLVQRTWFKPWRVFRGWNTGFVFARMAAVAGALGWLCAYHVNSPMVTFNYALIGSVKLEGCICIRGRAKSVSFPSQDCDIISSLRVCRVCESSGNDLIVPALAYPATTVMSECTAFPCCINLHVQLRIATSQGDVGWVELVN